MAPKYLTKSERLPHYSRQDLHRMTPTLRRLSMADHSRFPNPSWGWCPLACTILFALTCCAPPPPPAEEAGNPGRDYAAIQAEVREEQRSVAQAYREEHAGELPTTAEEVIARHLEAVGGREAFDTIQTLVLRFTAHSTSGTAGELVRYHKKPLHYRQQMIGSPRAAVTDGERFWWVNSDGWESDPEEVGAYSAFISMDNHSIDPGALGITHELLGVSALDGDPGFEVKRILPGGDEEVLYFSALSGLLTARRTSYPLLAESWFSFWDYRDLGGVRIPFVHIRSVGEMGPPHGLVLQSVEVNVPLPDSLFLPPAER